MCPKNILGAHAIWKTLNPLFLGARAIWKTLNPLFLVSNLHTKEQL
jgi:hypothetical protein